MATRLWPVAGRARWRRTCNPSLSGRRKARICASCWPPEYATVALGLIRGQGGSRLGKFDKFKSGLPSRSGSNAVVPVSGGTSRLIDKAKAEASQSTSAQRVIESASPRFVIALDATGSMAGLIENAKASIGEIISRVSAEAGEPVQIQLLAYRDYDCEQDVLERSPMSNRPETLISWLKGIAAHGGGGNDGEAVELALTEVLDGPRVRAVIIAGDEPPNSSRSITAAGRQSPTAIELAKRFGNEQIPIHTFVVGERASTVRDFKQMAALSGGKSGFLDGSREMIDMAVMAMLSALKGRDGVQAYMRKTKLSPNAQDFGSLLLSGPK